MPLMQIERTEEEAKSVLPRQVFDYYAGGAGDECSIRDNTNAFRRIHFIPRFFRDVSCVTTRTHIPDIGSLSFPAMIAPMAMQKLANVVGETGVANAAKLHGIPFILSSFSTVPLEEVSKIYGDCENGGGLLFQLYLFKDRSHSERVLRRAASTGYKVIVLTVDAPRFGIRRRDHKKNLFLPKHMSFSNVLTDKRPTSLGELSEMMENQIDVDVIQWIKQVTGGLPVWVKGLIHPDDAVQAVQAGASGIVVSNHGGRQVEGCLPTAMALPKIAQAIRQKATVVVDSGVRSGADIVKALGLGADAVLLGRPILWGLARNGAEGVSEVIDDFKRDMETTMALCGATDVDAIDSSLIWIGYVSKM